MHYAVITFDSANDLYYLYLDGTIVASASSHTGTLGTTSLDIGVSGLYTNSATISQHCNKAWVCEVLRHTRVLSPSDIQVRASQYKNCNNLPVPSTTATTSASRVRSAATPLSTGTPLNVTVSPIVLTSGTWILSGCVSFEAGGNTAASTIIAAISATSATLPGSDTEGVSTNGEVLLSLDHYNTFSANSHLPLTLPTATVVINPGSTLTLYLVAQSTFSVDTLSCFGSINAQQIA